MYSTQPKGNGIDWNYPLINKKIQNTNKSAHLPQAFQRDVDGQTGEFKRVQPLEDNKLIKSKTKRVSNHSNNTYNVPNNATIKQNEPIKQQKQKKKADVKELYAKQTEKNELYGKQASILGNGLRKQIKRLKEVIGGDGLNISNDHQGRRNVKHMSKESTFMKQPLMNPSSSDPSERKAQKGRKQRLSLQFSVESIPNLMTQLSNRLLMYKRTRIADEEEWNTTATQRSHQGEEDRSHAQNRESDGEGSQGMDGEGVDEHGVLVLNNNHTNDQALQGNQEYLHNASPFLESQKQHASQFQYKEEESEEFQQIQEQEEQQPISGWNKLQMYSKNHRRANQPLKSQQNVSRLSYNNSQGTKHQAQRIQLLFSKNKQKRTQQQASRNHNGDKYKLNKALNNSKSNTKVKASEQNRLNQQIAVFSRKRQQTAWYESANRTDRQNISSLTKKGTKSRSKSQNKHKVNTQNNQTVGNLIKNQQKYKSGSKGIFQKKPIADCIVQSYSANQNKPIKRHQNSKSGQMYQSKHSRRQINAKANINEGSYQYTAQQTVYHAYRQQSPQRRSNGGESSQRMRDRKMSKKVNKNECNQKKNNSRINNGKTQNNTAYYSRYSTIKQPLHDRHRKTDKTHSQKQNENSKSRNRQIDSNTRIVSAFNELHIDRGGQTKKGKETYKNELNSHKSSSIQHLHRNQAPSYALTLSLTRLNSFGIYSDKRRQMVDELRTYQNGPHLEFYRMDGYMRDNDEDSSQGELKSVTSKNNRGYEPSQDIAHHGITMSNGASRDKGLSLYAERAPIDYPTPVPSPIAASGKPTSQKLVSIDKSQNTIQNNKVETVNNIELGRANLNQSDSSNYPKNSQSSHNKLIDYSPSYPIRPVSIDKLVSPTPPAYKQFSRKFSDEIGFTSYLRDMEKNCRSVKKLLEDSYNDKSEEYIGGAPQQVAEEDATTEQNGTTQIDKQTQIQQFNNSLIGKQLCVDSQQQGDKIEEVQINKLIKQDNLCNPSNISHIQSRIQNNEFKFSNQQFIEDQQLLLSPLASPKNIIKGVQNKRSLIQLQSNGLEAYFQPKQIDNLNQHNSNDSHAFKLLLQDSIDQPIQINNKFVKISNEHYGVTKSAIKVNSIAQSFESIQLRPLNQSQLKQIIKKDMQLLIDPTIIKGSMSNYLLLDPLAPCESPIAEHLSPNSVQSDLNLHQINEFIQEETVSLGQKNTKKQAAHEVDTKNIRNFTFDVPQFDEGVSARWKGEDDDEYAQMLVNLLPSDNQRQQSHSQPQFLQDNHSKQQQIKRSVQFLEQDKIDTSSPELSINQPEIPFHFNQKEIVEFQQEVDSDKDSDQDAIEVADGFLLMKRRQRHQAKQPDLALQEINGYIFQGTVGVPETLQGFSPKFCYQFVESSSQKLHQFIHQLLLHASVLKPQFLNEVRKPIGLTPRSTLRYLRSQQSQSYIFDPDVSQQYKEIVDLDVFYALEDNEVQPEEQEDTSTLQRHFDLSLYDMVNESLDALRPLGREGNKGLKWPTGPKVCLEQAMKHAQRKLQKIESVRLGQLNCDVEALDTKIMAEKWLGNWHRQESQKMDRYMFRLDEELLEVTFQVLGEVEELIFNMEATTIHRLTQKRALTESIWGTI